MVCAILIFDAKNNFSQILLSSSLICLVLIKQIISLGDNTKLFLQGKAEEAQEMNQNQIAEMKSKFLGTSDFNDRSKLINF